MIRSFKIHIILFFILLYASYGIKNTAIAMDKLVQFALYPTGLESECYLVEIDRNANYQIEYGIRDSAFKNYIKLKSTEIKKIIQLGTQDYDVIRLYSEKVSRLGNIKKKQILKGGWIIFIKTNANIIEMNLNELSKENNMQIKLLVKKIMNLSPVKINIHSWS